MSRYKRTFFKSMYISVKNSRKHSRACNSGFLLPETRPVPGLGRPALFDQQLEPLGAGGGDGQLEGVAAHPPDDGRAVHVLVGDLAGQQLPHAHTERPDVHLEIRDSVISEMGRL